MSRSAGAPPVPSRPPMESRPAAGASSPATMCRVVLFPHPDGPTSTTNSPSSTSRSMPCTPTRPFSYTLRNPRSEEHTSELKSRQYLVCRLLVEKKNKSSSQRSFFPPRSSLHGNREYGRSCKVGRISHGCSHGGAPLYRGSTPAVLRGKTTD